jgi:predicted RNA-binding protein
LLHPDDKIDYYDRRMNDARAEELRPMTTEQLKRLISEEGYDRIVVNMGKEYRAAIEGFDRGVEVDVELVDGDGIGYKGHVLKRFVRGDDSVLEVYN